MANSQTNSDLQDLMPYLSAPERAELEAILAATPEPVEIVFTIVRPDRTIESHLVREPDGELRELTSQEISEHGLQPTTPEGYCKGV